MKFLAVLTFAIITFSSCDKITQAEFIIANNASSDISLSGLSSDGISLDQVIGAGESVSILSTGNLGKSLDLLDPESYLGSDFTIVNALGDTLQKDYASILNWDAQIEETSGTAIHQYVLNILESDF